MPPSRGGASASCPAPPGTELRREALDKLLEKRSEVTPHAVQAFEMPTYPAHAVGQLPALAARFANAGPVPGGGGGEAAIPDFPDHRSREHPRGMAGENAAGAAAGHVRQARAKTAARLDALQDAGFAGGGGQQPAQLRYTDGWTLYGGLGLNVTNPMSAARYASPGGAGHAFAAPGPR